MSLFPFLLPMTNFKSNLRQCVKRRKLRSKGDCFLEYNALPRQVSAAFSLTSMHFSCRLPPLSILSILALLVSFVLCHLSNVRLGVHTYSTHTDDSIGQSFYVTTGVCSVIATGVCVCVVPLRAAVCWCMTPLLSSEELLVSKGELFPHHSEPLHCLSSVCHRCVCVCTPHDF